MGRLNRSGFLKAWQCLRKCYEDIVACDISNVMTRNFGLGHSPLMPKLFGLQRIAIQIMAILSYEDCRQPFKRLILPSHNILENLLYVREMKSSQEVAKKQR